MEQIIYPQIERKHCSLCGFAISENDKNKYCENCIRMREKLKNKSKKKPKIKYTFGWNWLGHRVKIPVTS